MNELVKVEWYQNLFEECKAIICETEFTARWALVEGYHALGERIRQDADKIPVTELVQGLAVDLNKSERTLWYAVQFYDKYPRLDTVPEGKAISWNKIVTKYLPQEEGKEHMFTKRTITCPKCGHEIELTKGE